MNAQGRGHAGDIDPADQWVFDPNTGSYQLRLNDAADGSASEQGSARPTAPRQRRSSTGSRRSRGADRAGAAEGAGAAGETAAAHGSGGRRVPGQRRKGKKVSGAAATAGAATVAGHRSGGHGRRSRRARTGLSKKQKALRWGGGALGLLLVAGCTGGYIFYDQLNGNISKVDVGMNNAATTDGPVNILVMGTDKRDGKGNAGYGDTGSVGHADTTILLHVSKDRSNATALSIPRDMLTDIPDCPTKQKDGTTKTIRGQQQARFNTSLGQSERDPGCTWRTVEKMVGIKINHFMLADFNAVKELSTAVGGVPVCAGKEINDPKSHLHLTPGKHTVKGEQALAFVRTRHSVGLGSDLSRIELQQQFLSSLMRKMQSGDTLSSPSKLMDLSSAATKALTVDTGIGTVGKLYDLANDLKQVKPKNITFATLPVLDNPDDPATVIQDKAKAKPLFNMIRNDQSLTKTKQEKAKKKKAALNAKQAPASEVNVAVQNGGGPPGAAQQTADWLGTKGVGQAQNGGNAGGAGGKTKLEFSHAQAGQAATVAHLLGLPKSALKPGSGGGGAMKLTLGQDFNGPGKPVEVEHKAPAGVQNVNGNDKNICAK
ncbi:LCP family protein [Streptomyces sp. ODS28]|uniref:LCP family protein n=1 Tax=Streptomyces sp. ODS28 TaxID=3136688 RepID=UPI0031E5790F